ncbi:MAG: DNA recombination protein RmuC [Proteobacteria bacterium]|nr:DNA recombination protein RmuC [Pseudomonadota bacterium]
MEISSYVALFASLALIILLLLVIMFFVLFRAKVIIDEISSIANITKDVLLNQEKQREIIQNGVLQAVQAWSMSQQRSLDSIQQQLIQIAGLNENKLENMRMLLEHKLSKLNEENNTKLEQIRETVHEKLSSTLEKRLGESFQLISERLEMVYKGLGEMQTLASGVGDLKKVLSNVKVRGIWGEMQLGNILEQIMSSDQYAANVAVRADANDSRDRVEYAIKLPGRDSQISHVYLPIDAKFPLSDYQRLVDAQHNIDIAEIEIQSKALEANIRKSAKLISEKYICPPYTTDFAIMFLPIEGLYAEVLRRPGLVESLQQEYRVNIASPTTLSVFLNSLQMGFKTLAIEKRSSEVWRILEQVQHEFVKFADVLSKTKAKLEQAGSAIGQAERRSKIIRDKLKNIGNGSNASDVALNHNNTEENDSSCVLK